jgi:integrase
MLRAHRIRQAKRLLAIGHRVTADDLIFTDAVGDPLWGRHVTTRQLEPLLRRAELPRIRFHDLRHTFATLQLAAGTNPKIVSEIDASGRGDGTTRCDLGASHGPKRRQLSTNDG